MMDTDEDYFDMEVVLRSFSIDDEAHFLTQFKEMRIDMKLTPFNNFIEDWEAEAISRKHNVIGQFKLSNKYMGLVLHDKEEDDYDEVRRVIAVVWSDTGGRSDSFLAGESSSSCSWRPSE